LFKIVSDASSFISDTASFTETFADTRALSFGTSLTTAKPRSSPSAWTTGAVHIAMEPISISRRETRDVIAYFLGMYNSSRESPESGRSTGDLAWPAEEPPPWLTAFIPIGLTDLGRDVVAGASQNIMNPRTRTRSPTRVMTRRDMDVAPMANHWQLQYANR
jgi:hypothetical protein